MHSTLLMNLEIFTEEFPCQSLVWNCILNISGDTPVEFHWKSDVCNPPEALQVFLLNWDSKRERRVFNLSLQAPSWLRLILTILMLALTHHGLRSHYVTQYTRADGCQKAIFFPQKGSPKAAIAKHEAMQPTVTSRVGIFVSHNPGKKTQLIACISQHSNQLLGSSQSAEIKYSINVMKLIKVVPKITQGRIFDVRYFELPLY